jgi:hypothetical protein
MNTYSLERGMDVQPTLMETEALTQSGFSLEEIASLLRLRDWYQYGGSDRVELVRHLEFLKFLVQIGKLP